MKGTVQARGYSSKPKITRQDKLLKGIYDKIGELAVRMMMILRIAALGGGFIMHLIDNIYLAILHASVF